MDNIFEKLFQYGFHDTELSSIDCDNSEIKLNFVRGIYLLDINGKETILSSPIQIILKIKSCIKSIEEVMEIKEYGKRLKYLEYKALKKYFKKGNFDIWMIYYSNFNNCLLFDGGFRKKRIIFSIEEIDEIIINEII